MADMSPAVQSRALRVAIAAALAVVPVLLLAGYVLVQAFVREDAMRDALNRSFLTRTQTQKVLSLMQDAETGQRGYMITGDDVFLGPYVVASKEIPDALSELEALADPAQSVRMRALRRSSDAKLAELELTISMRRAGQIEQGMTRVRSGLGRKIMDEVRATIAAIEGHEVALLEHRLDEARRARRGTELLTSGLFASWRCLSWARASRSSRRCASVRSSPCGCRRRRRDTRRCSTAPWTPSSLSIRAAASRRSTARASAPSAARVRSLSGGTLAWSLSCRRWVRAPSSSASALPVRICATA